MDVYARRLSGLKSKLVCHFELEAENGRGWCQGVCVLLPGKGAGEIWCR